MQRLEVSGAVRLIYKSLGVKGLSSAVHCPRWFLSTSENGIVSNIGKQSKMKIYTDTRRLTTGIRSEKCVIR